MVKRWKDVRNSKLSKAAQSRVDEWVAEESLKLNLQRVRELVGLTQEELAERLEVSQGTLSRAERSTDPKLSTLRRHVEALGGKVEVVAVFDDKTVRLDV
jgi:DNA-binding XRE family transcriptional regulator